MIDPKDPGRAATAVGSSRSARLLAAIDRLWSTMAPAEGDFGLIPQLAFDALWSRAVRDEFETATPRLAELLIGGSLTIEQADVVVTHFGSHRWSTVDRGRTVEELLDAWWAETLALESAEHTPGYGPDVVLGVLAASGSSMVRWLHPWLTALDGPAAGHLAHTVLRGLSGPAWDGRGDEAAQVLAWAKTETVVNGMALIGGTHLDDGQLSELLDALL